jgi:hypothetical protein
MEHAMKPSEDPAAAPAFEQEMVKSVKPEEMNPAEGAKTEAEPTVDEFDPANLRLPQAFIETTGVKRHLKMIPVRRPKSQEFVRVSRTLRLDPASMVYLEEDREFFLVHPTIVPIIQNDTIAVTLFGAVNRQEVFFFWPVRIPTGDGRAQDWHRSQREMAELAMCAWIRIKANQSLGGYEPFEAENVKVDPVWPDLPINELLRIAFSRDRLINRLDHPVIARLKGRR